MKNSLLTILNVILSSIKFLLGWIIWWLIFLISIIFSLLTWNWKETYTISMKNVIVEICGESTWNIMFFGENY